MRRNLGCNGERVVGRSSSTAGKQRQNTLYRMSLRAKVARSQLVAERSACETRRPSERTNALHLRSVSVDVFFYSVDRVTLWGSHDVTRGFSVQRVQARGAGTVSQPLAKLPPEICLEGQTWYFDPPQIFLERNIFWYAPRLGLSTLEILHYCE